MSGVVKGVKKVFKKIGQAVKKIVKSPIFKAIVIAAAIYFTGGLAAGAMGSTTAAALPGISTAAEMLGIEAGAFATSAAESAFVVSETGLMVPAAEAVAEGGTAAASSIEAAGGATQLAGEGMVPGAETGFIEGAGNVTADAAGNIAKVAEAGAPPESYWTQQASAATPDVAPGEIPYSSELPAPAEAPVPEPAPTPSTGPQAADWAQNRGLLQGANPALEQPWNSATMGTMPNTSSATQMLTGGITGEGSGWLPKWFTELHPLAQQAVLQGAGGAAKGALGALQAAKQREWAQEQRDEMLARNTYDHNVTSWKAKTPEPKSGFIEREAKRG